MPPPAKPPKPKIHTFSPLTSISNHNDSLNQLDTISKENIEPTQEINQDDGNSIPSLVNKDATDDDNDANDLTYHVKLAKHPSLPLPTGYSTMGPLNIPTKSPTPMHPARHSTISTLSLKP
jgi:hypothetical protein